MELNHLRRAYEAQVRTVPTAISCTGWNRTSVAEAQTVNSRPLTPTSAPYNGMRLSEAQSLFRAELQTLPQVPDEGFAPSRRWGTSF